MIRPLAFIASLFLVATPAAFAQQAPISTNSNVFMLSWRSNTFSPAGYAGRVAATGNSSLLVTAEAISGGSVVNLSNYEVRWYVNNELTESGLGMQSITIPIAEFHQNEIDVRAEIIGSPLAVAESFLTIPLVNPVAVIESAERGVLRSGANTLSAHAYSFNVTDADDLLYQWQVNGETPQATEYPRLLSLTIDGTPTSPVYITLTISHPDRPEETATAALTLTPDSSLEQ